MVAETQLDEEAIFNVACRIDLPDVRADYLQQVCSQDAVLRTRVEQLLVIHDQEREFLEFPPLAVASTHGRSLVTEGPGSVVGGYKLLQEIGEGGFGVVFMAETSQPVARKVALKVIKPGMDSREVIARFEVERQALALMDHPNIAKVLDAGATESGRPYFVMELINGQPITQFCDANKVSVPGRLRLFQTICQAVHHAHQKGVIHRDLKPGNILVTIRDGQPLAKIIDFGIAKALDHSSTTRPVFTGAGQIIGTPEYMSPEQAEMSAGDVDTRSDIYSLGVLLYELMAGQPPFAAETLRSAGFDEMRRIIQEEEPPLPSTRLTTLDPSTVTQVTAMRQSEPRALREALKGDLDCIAIKALEKNRERRYDTAAALAHDIQRYLDGEPVEARPPSHLYRVGKYLRKHRVLAAILSLAALSVLVALAVSVKLTHDYRQWAENLERKIVLQAKQQMLSDQERSRKAAITAQSELNKVRDKWQVHAYGEALDLIHSALARLENMPSCEANGDKAFVAAYIYLGNTYAALADENWFHESFKKWSEMSFIHNHFAREHHRLWLATQLYLNGRQHEGRIEFEGSKIDELLGHLDAKTTPFTRFGRGIDRLIATTYLCARAEQEENLARRTALLDRAMRYSVQEPLDHFCCGLALARQGETAKASEHFAAALESTLERLDANLRNQPIDLWLMNTRLRHLVANLENAGESERVDDVYGRAITACEEKLPRWHPVTASLRLQYGKFLMRAGKSSEAEPVLLAAYQSLINYGLAPVYKIQDAGEQLAKCCESRDAPDEAQKWRKRVALDVGKRQQGSQLRS